MGNSTATLLDKSHLHYARTKRLENTMETVNYIHVRVISIPYCANSVDVYARDSSFLKPPSDLAANSILI